MVETLAANGFPQLVLGAEVGVDLKTLRKYYRAELDRGSARFHAALVGHLWRLSQRQDGVGEKAVEFSLRCRFGWTQLVPPA